MRTVAVVLMLLAGAVKCPPDPAPTQSCHEGDSCWDCKTMGNRQCGPADPARQELTA